jgi:hypothetical protein
MRKPYTGGCGARTMYSVGATNSTTEWLSSAHAQQSPGWLRAWSQSNDLVEYVAYAAPPAVPTVDELHVRVDVHAAAATALYDDVSDKQDGLVALIEVR